MTPFLPRRLRPEPAALIPEDPRIYAGPAAPRWFVMLYLMLITARSLAHLFLPDGGAHSIATIDISVAGGRNIVALFGQWGAIQLLLAGLLWVLLLRYRGLTPLVIMVLLLEPFLRALAGHLKPLTTLGVAPGAAGNWLAAPILAGALWMALCPALPKPVSQA